MRSFKADRDEKLSRFLGRVFPELSYGYFRTLLRKKDIRIDGVKTGEDVMIYDGSEISVYSEESKLFVFKPKIEYEDDLIIIVNKPRGMSSEEYATRLKEYKGVDFLELAHRLDTNTEGLLIFAEDQGTLDELTLAFKNGWVHKAYIAMCVGKITQNEAGIKKVFLTKNESEGMVKISDKRVPGSEEIITEIIPLELIGKNTLLEIVLHTGKTHQIRAHLAYLKHPLIGDPKYGDYKVNRESGAKNQRLTAYKLHFTFPPKSPLAYLNSVKVRIISDFCGY